MNNYVWWDTECGDDVGRSEPFSADNFDSALHKATWMAAGDIGEQLEYDLDIALENIDTGVIQKWNVRVIYDTPTIYNTRNELISSD